MVETGSQCLATAKKFIHSSLQSRRCQKLGDALWCSHGHEADNKLTALVREEPSPPVSHLFCIAFYSRANLGYVKLQCAGQLKWFQLSVPSKVTTVRTEVESYQFTSKPNRLLHQLSRETHTQPTALLHWPENSVNIHSLNQFGAAADGLLPSMEEEEVGWGYPNIRQ